MPDTNALKKEISVINSPSLYNKHVAKTDSIDSKM